MTRSPQEEQPTGNILATTTVAEGQAAAPGTDVRRNRVYATAVKGTFNLVHRWSGGALLALFFLVPWIPVGGRPALLVDIPARRLYALGGIFTPGDVVFLLILGLGAAFGLFALTALLGRTWCGFLCPQTVLLEEIVRRFERMVEGARGPHMRRDQGPWTLDKAWRKAVKLLFLAGVSLLVTGTFVAYFTSARELFSLRAGPAATGFTLGLGALLFADLAWFRERFCIFLCPYARFQGALTDDDSLVVGYDAERGEPRAKGKRRPAGAGACVDCNRCVTVCPQGIDIRNGYQLECISCALCVDACTPVMQKFGQETLVRWETIGGSRRPRWLRPRTVGYGAILAVLVLAFAWNFITRDAVEADVNRLAGTLYTVDDDGWTRNTFMVLLTSKSGRAHDPPVPVVLSVHGIDGAELVAPDVALAPGETRRIPVVVRAPPSAGLPRTSAIRFDVRSGDEVVEVDTTFKSGAPWDREG